MPDSATNKMSIISIREHIDYKEEAISYFQKSWPDIPPVIYKDCIDHSITAKDSLPQWYLLEKEGQVIGCAGLITNDFISRMDLYPWVCALFIDPAQRNNDYGALLIEKAKQDAREAGFKNLYLCTDHVGYYEKKGFKYIGQGYHPWDATSRIYEIDL